MEEKITYKCGFCGTTYYEIHERMNCEAACHKKQAEEERLAAEAKKQEEKNTRKDEVDAAFEHLHALVTAYVKDYGHYEYDGKNTSFAWPSKLYHRFWF